MMHAINLIPEKAWKPRLLTIEENQYTNLFL
jgi:hypothetical protein